MSEATLIQELQKVIHGKVLTDTASLNSVSIDFGRMATKIPRVVVQPASSEDVALTIQIAGRYNIPVTARAAGHSQSGQSLNDGGVILDMTSLSSHLEINAEEKTCTVNAGRTWRSLVEDLKAHKLMPPVLTNNLNVTVGGTLSMAGIGVSSFRYGTQADNCTALQVVTGDGNIVECSRENNPELFTHTLCGLGQYGIITRATLKLRPNKSHVRVFYLLYDNLKNLVKDSRALMEESRMDYIEAWCTPLPLGFRKVQNSGKQPFAEWFYPMQLAFEFDGGTAAPDEKKCLNGLSFYRRNHTEDLEVQDYVLRLEHLFDLWKKHGYWDLAHPWMETLLPWDMAERYITQVLNNFPPNALGGGHILLWPANGKASTLPLFKKPNSDYIMGFGILPGIPRDEVAGVLPRLSNASELSEAMGAKRYLSGWIDFDKQKWKEHYADSWTEMKRMKRKFDPSGILNPGFIDFSA